MSVINEFTFDVSKWVLYETDFRLFLMFRKGAILRLIILNLLLKQSKQAGTNPLSYIELNLSFGNSLKNVNADAGIGRLIFRKV
jgi:hypothetical protein